MEEATSCDDISCSMLISEKQVSSIGTTMFAPEQVAAIIEHIKAEQSRLLKEQQDAIVQQVLRQLRESRPGDYETTEHITESHRSTAKLEKTLHNLVLHSLDESGLNYPHVLSSAYSTQHNKTVQSTRPSSRSQSHRKKKIHIVSRPEGVICQDEKTLASYEQISGQESGERTDVKSREKRHTQRFKDSPLLNASLSHKTRLCRQQQVLRSNRRVTKCDRIVDDEQADETVSRPNKVGQRTQAILDRSRALLNEIKEYKSDRPNIKGETSFVFRMRHKLVNSDLPDSNNASICSVKETGVVTDANDRGSQRAPSQEGSCDGEKECQPTAAKMEESLADGCRPIPSDTSTVICDDIDILRPPQHSPENDNEWENELARQILTIYATSVKAKVANRPPSRDVPTSFGSSGHRGRLTSSCSLPVIRRSATAYTTRQAGPCNQSPPRATVHYSWEPSQRLRDGKVIVNMPKIPKPIWFAGTGAVKAVWCAVADGFHDLQSVPSKSKPNRSVAAVCEHQLCEEVRRLEAKQQYSQCITTLETLLISLVRARGVDSLEMKLWKQLVVTCNAFASRCVDYKKYSNALQLIKQAEHLIYNSVLVTDAMRLELLAYLYDTYAHYYYRRGKPHAGLQYMFKAQEIHNRQSSWSHLAKCRLHIANLLSSQSKHKDAMGYMATILEMIEENKLEDQTSDGESTASAQKICLAAVCYNNMAIEQLHQREFEAASVSSGNAKRLAKLCLSYSNRWLAQFDATSNCVDLAIATLMEDVNADANAAFKPS